MRVAPFIVLIAGCWDLDRLEHLYQAPDLGEEADLARRDLAPPVDLECRLDDARHCGSCDHDCTTLLHVAADQVRCVAGACDVSNACLPGWGHCSSRPDDGCETDLGDAAHCGSCANVCTPEAPLCTSSGGTYVCGTQCGSAAPDLCGTSCVDLQTDADHCGSCTNPCPLVANGVPACNLGSCGFTCAGGFHACGGACADDHALASCGSSCAPCTPPAHAAATCDGSTCGFQCDDGYTTSGPGCVLIAKRVFVTSALFSSNLGGLSTAYQDCQDMATNAGLTGFFVAWLSDSFTDPVHQFAQASIPYALVDDTIIADNWNDLTDGTLRHAIDHDENGNVVAFDAGAVVWTGTHASGLKYYGAGDNETCLDWGTGNVGYRGFQGSPFATGPTWTESASADCTMISSARLYCFEQ